MNLYKPKKLRLGNKNRDVFEFYLIIEAIKEQQKEIENLKTEIEYLKTNK